MKKVIILSITLLTTISCHNTTEQVPTNEHFFNICLIIDGTDRIDKQQSIPDVDIDFVMDLAEKIQRKGGGIFWFTYISENSEKNPNAFLRVYNAPTCPKQERKKDYETPSEYAKKNDLIKAKFISDSITFEKGKAERFSKFRGNVQEILKMAYSDRVAKNKKGSDVHGAINLGIKLLQSYLHAPTSHLILVSDLIDNVGTELGAIPDDITVICVNQSFSRHKLDRIIQLELSSLEQLDYIFETQ